MKDVHALMRRMATRLPALATLRSSRPFLYYVDEPRARETIETPYVLLRGWVATTRNKAVENLTLRDSHMLRRPLKTVPRPDVEAAYARYSVIGFQELLPTQDLPPASEWSVEFNMDGATHRFPLEFSIGQTFLKDFLRKKSDKLERIRPIFQCPPLFVPLRPATSRKFYRSSFFL